MSEKTRTEKDPLGKLEVPADAPFSYVGKHLIFTWRVAARQPQRGLDPTRAQELTVLP